MTMHTRTIWHLVVATTACLLCAPPTRGADRYWIDPLGGPFNTTTNWSTTDGGVSGASVPVVGDIANFTLNNTYTVTFAGDHTNTSLDIDNGNVTFDLNGNTYTLTNQFAVDLGEQIGQTGRLTVRDGTLAVDTTGDDVTVGFNSPGYLTVTTGGRVGDGALLPDMLVGWSDTGSLTVNDNGRVDAANFELAYGFGVIGAATITGPNAVVDSTATAVGTFGTGSVNVQDGGTLTTSGNSRLGSYLGSSGTVNVSGVGSSWAANALFIGQNGDAALSISSGGQVSSGAAVVGDLPTGIGIATVSGANSLWDLSDVLSVGEEGHGNLAVANGGRVLSTSGSLGAFANSEGRATVTGEGSLWSMTGLTIGSSGVGDLTISDGGKVDAISAVLGSAATGSGAAIVTGTGSRLRVVGPVIIGSAGWGTLTVADDAEVDVGTNLTTSDPAGAPYGQLSLVGGSVYVSNDFTNNGSLYFADGLLQVTGDFQTSAIATAFTLNGSNYDDLPTLDLVGTGTTTNMTSLTVGNNRRGQLLLRQGRALDVGVNNINIGALPGSDGIVSVESDAELSTSGILAVGGQGTTAGGTGTLNIGSGGHVLVNTLKLFGDGEVNLHGGGLTVLDAFDRSGGQFNWTSGVLYLQSLASLPNYILGLDRTLRPGQDLRFASTVGLTEPIIIDGGELSAFTLNNQSTLEIRSGQTTASSSIQNNGLLLLSSPLAVLQGAILVHNFNTLRGTGTIQGNFTNASTGQVEVIAGDRLRITGAANSNLGHISVIGGELQIDNTLTNEASSGLISAREAILRFNTVTNNGSMAFSNGTVDVYGDITQNVGGRITVSNGGIANFYDDVTISAGAANVQATALGSTISRVVFFGGYNGGITGGGQAFIEGDHRPGNSPALVEFGGDVYYGPFSSLEIELAGETQGALYDAVAVSGAAVLGGELDVTLLDDFSPTLGSVFEILTATGGVTGMFDSEMLPSLGPLLTLRTFYGSNAVNLVVVPALEGDYNADGVINAADYTVWRDSMSGDIGGYNLWKASFGAGAGSGSGEFAAVPEPGGLALGLAGSWILLLGYGTRTRSRQRTGLRIC